MAWLGVIGYSKIFLMVGKKMASSFTFLHALLVSSLVQAGLADCRLEAVDMVTATAVARCGGDPVLLERGKKFRDLSIVDASPDGVVLTDSEGGTILWYIAEGARPSRIEHIRVLPPPGGDGEPLLAPAAGKPGASVPVSN